MAFFFPLMLSAVSHTVSVRHRAQSFKALAKAFQQVFLLILPTQQFPSKHLLLFYKLQRVMNTGLIKNFGYLVLVAIPAQHRHTLVWQCDCHQLFYNPVTSQIWNTIIRLPATDFGIKLGFGTSQMICYTYIHVVARGLIKSPHWAQLGKCHRGLEE